MPLHFLHRFHFSSSLGVCVRRSPIEFVDFTVAELSLPCSDIRHTILCKSKLKERQKCPPKICCFCSAAAWAQRIMMCHIILMDLVFRNVNFDDSRYCHIAKRKLTWWWSRLSYAQMMSLYFIIGDFSLLFSGLSSLTSSEGFSVTSFLVSFWRSDWQKRKEENGDGLRRTK